jgi:hypothetical protein
LVDRLHINEDSEKKVTESKNNLNSPILCANLPVTGIAMAFATPNEVITQVPSSVDAPRKPDIVGIATLEIVESNICINVANDNAIVTHHNVPPVNGAGVDLVIAIKVVHYAK